MAKLEESLKLYRQVEFSNRPEKLLHKNEGENGLTFYGIYESAHPNWKGWSIIKRYLVNEPDLEKCSIILSNVSDLNQLVYDFYLREFWNKADLDSIIEQRKADELFIFGTNAGMPVAIKKAQELVGVLIDGDVGPKTLKAINEYDVEKFDVFYDLEEKEHYDTLIARREALRINQKGWYNRADFV